MKRKTKLLIGVCSMLSMLTLATACSGRIGVKEWIDQQICEHEFDDGEVQKEATCLEVGELLKTCSLCNKQETEEIELLEHTEIIVETVAATCLEPGMTEGKKCSVCNTVIEGMKEIAPTGHTVVKNVSTTATCTDSGYFGGEYCSVCNEVITKATEIPALGHTEVLLPAVSATCTETGLTEGSKCSVCDIELIPQVELPVVAHYEVTKAAVAATCMKSGLTEGKYCYRCNEVFKEQQVIPATGHEPITVEGTPATCFKKGLTNGQKCRKCDMWFTPQLVIEATGHIDVVADGICDQCGEVTDFSSYFYYLTGSSDYTLKLLEENHPLEAYSVYRLVHDFSNDTGIVTEFKFLDSDDEQLSSQVYFFKMFKGMAIIIPNSEDVISLDVLYYMAPDLSYIDFCIVVSGEFYDNKVHFSYNDTYGKHTVETRLAINVENLYEVIYEDFVKQNGVN